MEMSYTYLKERKNYCLRKTWDKFSTSIIFLLFFSIYLFDSYRVFSLDWYIFFFAFVLIFTIINQWVLPFYYLKAYKFEGKTLHLKVKENFKPEHDRIILLNSIEYSKMEFPFLPFTYYNIQLKYHDENHMYYLLKLRIDHKEDWLDILNQLKKSRKQVISENQKNNAVRYLVVSCFIALLPLKDIYSLPITIQPELDFELLYLPLLLCIPLFSYQQIKNFRINN